MTPRTPSCYSHMPKFSCCKSPEHWREEFEGPGPKMGNVGSYPCASSHRPTEAVPIYTDIGSALEFNKSLHVYPSVGKGCRSYFLCLFNPQLQNCCRKHPAAATARQLWKTNLNPETKGKSTVEHEEAIISLVVITSRNVTVLLELPFYLFIVLETDPALVRDV